MTINRILGKHGRDEIEKEAARLMRSNIVNINEVVQHDMRY